ncbi:MAG: ATPase [Sphingomonadales bacterium]|nr:MAG: ATPase [Sphingomonadales bacterium]
MKAHVIVLGNEKGGSGKSTTAVHIAVALAHQGLKVGAIDLDGRQRSMARYLENRATHAARHGLTPPTPEVMALMDGDQATDAARFDSEAAPWLAEKDVIVVDCPGRDSALSRAAHAHADTLITPMNDSFVDFDLLGQVDPDSLKVSRPSVYAEMVWNSRKARARRDGQSIDWIVLRTRLSHLEARNMRRVGDALDQLAKRIGFRVIPGLSERVIFRELFPQGQTLLDLGQAAPLTMSQLSARQELRDLMGNLNLPVAKAATEDGVLVLGDTAA